MKTIGYIMGNLSKCINILEHFGIDYLVHKEGGLKLAWWWTSVTDAVLTGYINHVYSTWKTTVFDPCDRKPSTSISENGHG